MSCLTARCEGQYAQSPPKVDYFNTLYRRGEVARVFAAEHTGLLTRTVREATEQAFKAAPEDRDPWSPNLLSCTPTLEMGIDIGALSSAILCSVPPAQANYLQRIGRAGRRDGNSFLLTIALGRDHDQFFFAKPEEMISGAVSPPGIFLNASAVLERQLAAFCLDRWIATGVPKDAVPKQLVRVFDHLDDQTHERFPHNWLHFVLEREDALLAAFLGLFGDAVGDDARAHLRDFLLGDKLQKGSLAWNVLDAFTRENAQRQSLTEQASKAKAEYEREKATLAKSKDHDERLAERRREYRSLEELVKGINRSQVLEFLTDRGLLPNYAFPESPIRLKSVIWSKKHTKLAGDKSNYDTKTFEYSRPAMAAISELAPNNTFFAGARSVKIEQIDVGTSTIETWRFCDKCSYNACIDTDDLVKNCPACKSPTWGEDTQKSSMLRLEQVFAKTSDRRSRIRDDADQRQPRFYNRRMLMSFSKQDSAGAFHTDDDKVPFGFEYLSRAQFQEVNFGESSDEGTNVVICGQEEIREGFVICRECGMVQPRKPKSDTAPVPDPKHTLWCSAAKKKSAREDFQAAVYLYRQFNSEAIRMLLPLSDIGSEQRLNSFLAAFQLGLRDKYGGRVDHLHTLLYSEPEEDGFLRRQYLVLYDTVPGGTGYLKDFTQPPRDDETKHPLFDILDRAMVRMSTCECSLDPEKDGCYRCIYAYRNSREMEQTSRKVAMEMFGNILTFQDKLTHVDSLSNVSISGLMDSVLEARFIEALRRHKGISEPVVLYKDVIRNKPGFRVIVDGQSWSIEQQRTLDDADGIRPKVSIDFVFHPDDTTSGRKPIAVFLDGFQFHRDRACHDMLQRMTLLNSGYDVWTLSWYDVDEAFHTNVEPAPAYLHPELSTLNETVRKLCDKAAADHLSRPLLELLVHDLGGPCFLPTDQTAAAALLSQLAPATPATLDIWRKEVDDRTPQAVNQWLSSADMGDFIVHRPPTSGGGFGMWVFAPKSAVSGKLDPSGFRGLVWLDDHPSRHYDKAFLADWRGFLHVFQQLRSLPNLWFLTRNKQEEADFTLLSEARSIPTQHERGRSQWDELDVLPEFEPIVEQLQNAGATLPTIGEDVPSARGPQFTSDVLAELLWMDLRVAVVEQLDGSERAIPADWTLFTLAELLNDITPLLSALSLTGHTA
jgi:DEAD/DEAH box helicase domain-containing protein